MLRFCTARFHQEFLIHRSKPLNVMNHQLEMLKKEDKLEIGKPGLWNNLAGFKKYLQFSCRLSRRIEPKEILLLVADLFSLTESRHANYQFI